MKIKFQCRLNRPNCALWMNFIGGQGWSAIITLVKHGRGYILKPPSINLHTWPSKQMPSVPEEVRAEVFLSVRCNAGPTEGPGKILKYRSNLRLYPVNFGNKLCILIFIILSIWLNFFDPPPLLRKTFWSPPSGNSKLFWPPSILPSPPHQSIYERSLAHIFSVPNNHNQTRSLKNTLYPTFYCMIKQLCVKWKGNDLQAWKYWNFLWIWVKFLTRLVKFPTIFYFLILWSKISLQMTKFSRNEVFHFPTFSRHDNLNYSTGSTDYFVKHSSVSLEIKHKPINIVKPIRLKKNK